MNRIACTYRIASDDPREVALDICIEQTAECHSSLVTDRRFQESILGRLESLTDAGSGVHEAVITYPEEITAYQIPQLLHVLYGNISLKKGIRLDKLDLPPSFTSRFPGPRHGIRGIRDLLGVHDRPLLAAALKPMGLSPSELADRALGLSLGGIDILKDDHGLADHSFCPFEDRVRAVTSALRGRRTLYFPSLTERFSEIEPRAELAASLGASGLLISPLATGLDVLSRLPLPVMAHPALSGAFFSDPSHGISPPVLLGTLLRLAGADLVIFPSHHGRFPFSRSDALGIASALRSPLHGLAPSLPVPAGGIDVEGVRALADDYGPDTVLLIGSSLYTRSPDLAANAARFLDLVTRG